MSTYSKSDIAEIAKGLGIKISETWTGLDAVWPLLNLMMKEGAVVLIKLDGQRNPEMGDNGPYTVVAQNGQLGKDIVRGDFENLDDALCALIGGYFSRTARPKPTK